MRRLKDLTNIPVAILTGAIFVGAIALAIVSRPLKESLVHQQEAAKLADLEAQSRQRTDWWPGRWPPPDTPVA
jgi:hypothetical protein